jgi:hypothetical protein
LDGLSSFGNLPSRAQTPAQSSLAVDAAVRHVEIAIG